MVCRTVHAANDPAHDLPHLTEAIGWLNAAPRRFLELGCGVFDTGGAQLPPVTGQRIGIYGEWAVISGSGLSFVGAGGVTVSGVEINAPGKTGFTVDGSTDVRIECSTVGNTDRLAHITGLSSRTVLSRIVTNISAVGAIGEHHVLIDNAAATELERVTLNSPNAADGGFAHVAVAPAGLVDTVWIRECSFQSFTTTTPPAANAADGKSYGLLVDATGGPATNLFCHSSVFDHTTTAGFSIRGGGGNIRKITITESRNDADAGVNLATDSAGSAVFEDVRFENNHLHVNGGPWETNTGDPYVRTVGNFVRGAGAPFYT